jgi:peptide/nickel transport system substrate-binding protein
LEGGAARIEEVTVGEGDAYLNPETLQPDQLGWNKPYQPSGCYGQACQATYTGGEVSMDRMAVDFELLPDLRWSDGEPLTAADSIFSYQVETSAGTEGTKYLVHRTESYLATGDREVRWVGIPGFMDPEYRSNFWIPLPEHRLAGHTPSELYSLEEATHRPLGWGPYVIDRWTPGEELSMVRNEAYFRAPQGLPRFDRLRFRFLGAQVDSALEQVVTGECDLLDEAALARADWPQAQVWAEEGKLKLASVPGSQIARLDFNLAAPLGDTGVTALGDPALREALAGCIDREGLASGLSLGMAPVAESYLPVGHPLYAAGDGFPPFDQARAETQLDELGWLDEDGQASTPRTASGVPGMPQGAALQFELLAAPGSLERRAAERLAEDLSQCGAGLKVSTLDPEELFAPWPEGPVFGRSFEMVSWAWPAYVSPPCEMFAGFEIPSQANQFGVNVSGFALDSYDAACDRILLGPPEGSAYESAVQSTQALLREHLPTLPLYVAPRVLAYGVDLCGVEPSGSSLTMLWNLEALGSGAECGES